MRFPVNVSRPIFTLPLPGDMAVAAESMVLPGTGACVTHYRASMRVAPTGADAEIQVYLGDRVTGAREALPFEVFQINAGQYSTEGSLSEATRISSDKFVQLVCIQAGSTIPGTDFIVELFGGGGGGPLPGNANPLTTKGDVYGFDTEPARIPVGTNGQVLTADSGEALGVKWDTPAAGSFTGCRVELNVAQAVPDSVETLIIFDTEVYDVGGFFAIGSPTNFVIPTTGKYRFTYTLLFQTAGASLASGFIARLKVNGTDILENTAGAISSFVGAAGVLSADLALTAADVVTVSLYHNITGSANAKAVVCALKIG